MYLYKNGKTDYVAVLPENPSAYEKAAASELQWITQMYSGEKISLISESRAVTGENKYIFIGPCGQTIKSGYLPPRGQIGAEGFRLKTDGQSVYLAGVNRGALFAVYRFCEMFFGYRYYGVGEVRISKYADRVLETVDSVEKPDIAARTLGFYETFYAEQPDIADNINRLYLARNPYTDWVLATHTYFLILPKSDYEKTHRDFYSPDGANLCLTNEKMKAEFIRRLTGILEERDGEYIMIGQEDNFTFCDCPRCAEQIKKYGTASAVMMRFSNDVARAVKERFKNDVKKRSLQVVTFAYNGTAVPPVRRENGEYVPADPSVIAEDNLSVMFVPRSPIYSESFLDEKYNKRVKESFEGWSAVAKDLHIWQYCTNFDHYGINFYNLHAIRGNYGVLKKYGASFIFDQGPYNHRTPCFDAFRAFLQARLLWDTQADTAALTEEFFAAYYKDIAPQMLKYYRMFCERWDYIEKKFGEKARTGGCGSSYWYLSNFWPREFLEDCMEVFREARGVLESICVERWDDYVTLKKRMERERISVRHLLLRIYGRVYGDGLPALINAFLAACKEHGIEGLSEGGGILVAD